MLPDRQCRELDGVGFPRVKLETQATSNPNTTTYVGVRCRQDTIITAYGRLVHDAKRFDEVSMSDCSGPCRASRSDEKVPTCLGGHGRTIWYILCIASCPLSLQVCYCKYVVRMRVVPQNPMGCTGPSTQYSVELRPFLDGFYILLYVTGYAIRNMRTVRSTKYSAQVCCIENLVFCAKDFVLHTYLLVQYHH